MQEVLPIDRDALLAARVDDQACSYTVRDTILYALGVGFGCGIGSVEERPYLYGEGPMRTVPTMANRLLDGAFIRGSGCGEVTLVHGAERLQLYRPLPPRAELMRDSRVTGVEELDGGRCLRIAVEAEVRLAADDTVIASCGRTYYGAGTADKLPPALDTHPASSPSREPDLTCDVPTYANQALLFGLADSQQPHFPEVAVSAGTTFTLQERCVFGIACHAILRTICGYDFTLISDFAATFPAPAFAGDVISTEMWQQRNVVTFRCLVRERDSVVLDAGRCTLAA